MADQNFDKEVSINLPIGHLIVLWDIVSNKLSDAILKDELTEEERRAVWSLEDLCEKSLVQHGYGVKSSEEWNTIITKAQKYCKSLPADFLD